MSNQPNQPQKEKAKSPFGPAQVRLFKFILAHPGCTMAEISEGEFPDKHKNYVWNLLSENKAYIDKREIGDRIPNQFRMKMKELAKAIDLNHYIQTGNIRMRLVQGGLDFTQPQNDDEQLPA